MTITSNINHFLEYLASNGHRYALHPQQIRGFDGTEKETRVLATIGGVPLTFRVKKPYTEVVTEWKAAMERGSEEAA
jgi:hypothetical protein